MKRNISLWQFAGFAFTSLGGTILHYLYELTGRSVLAAPFSGINESTWEHMKLLFFPLFLFAAIQSFFFKDYKGFWCVKLAGTAVGLILIPAIFYTYNGAFGKSPDWFNIAIFFICAAVVFLLEAYLLKKDSFKCKRRWIPIAVLCVIGVLFILFTFITPTLPLFLDPLTGTHGING